MIRNSISRSKQAALRLSLNVSSALLVPLLAATTPAQAQSASATSTYNIPAQSLGSALREYMRQSGVQVGFPSEIGDNVTASAVVGTFSAPEALSRLLAGTGLTFRFTGASTVTLERAPQAADGTVNLGPVRVEGDGAGTPIAGDTSLVNGMVTTEGTRSYTTNGPVTAGTGLGLTLRETPQSVTVITRQRLDDQSLITLGDALNQTPGVVFQPAGPAVGGRTPLYSRGYQVDSYQIDGLTVSSYSFSYGGGLEGSSSMDTAIYDSITILRGAPGLLAGAGNPGATISLTRKRPTRDFQASVSQSLGTWEQHRTVADVGGPLNAAGTIRARVVGAYDAGEGWQDRYDYEKYLGYGVVEADLGSSSMLSLILDHSNDAADGTGPYTGLDVLFSNGTPTPFGRSDNSMADWSRFQKKTTNATAMLDHRFGDWKANLTYQRTVFESSLKFGNIAATPDPDGFTDLMARRYDVKNRSNVLQFKLDGRYSLFGREHELVFGATGSWLNEKYLREYTDRAYDRVETIGWNGDYPEPDWDSLLVPGSIYKTNQYGVWAATRLRPSDTLAVIVGARWSRWNITGTDLATGDRFDDREEKGVLTPYIGATFDVTPNLSIYASYTTIFNPQFNQDVNGRLLDPEEGSNIELGVKGEWFDGRLNASAAIFEVRKDNLAILDGTNLTPRGDDAYRTADGTKGRGWEVEIAGEALPGLQVQGGYTYIKTEDANGARLFADQPKHTFKLFASWTPRNLQQLTLGGGVTWQSSIYPDYMPPETWAGYTQGSYAVASLMARYEINDHIGVTVNLTNLFDEAYRTDPTQHAYGTPRSVMGTVRAKF
jgi:outer membrane receptor for ferric coprogen and ferric-rhodotorulic acid